MSKARDIADGAANINLLDDVTAGTVAASKVIAADANKDVASFRNVTMTGELDAATLDLSGNADIDGVLETDGLSINGTSVTSTAAELNILDGVTSTAAELNILDGVTSTTAELNILDGVTSTAAELNVVDGLARGALIYGNASAATATLSAGSSGTVLTSDGTDIAWAAAGGGGFANLSVFTSSGTFTIPSGVETMRVIVVGAGGGGGGQGGGAGSSGGNSTLTSGTETITTITGGGGSGGDANNGYGGSAGGSASTTASSSGSGAIGIVGGAGAGANENSYSKGSHGGNSFLGGGAAPYRGTGINASGYGGGGGGGGSRNLSAAGAGGGGGTVIKYLTGLTAGNTITVTIGAGGAKASGSGGSSGGNGKQGIIVFEY